MTALCLLYLANFLAEPSSLNSTKFAKEINLPVVLDLTKIFVNPSLFLLSTKYCWSIIGYYLPSLLNLVTVLPP